MEVAQGDVEDGPAGQGEKGDKLQDGKATAGFLRRRLGVAFLVPAGIGQLGSRGVGYLEGPPLKLAALADAAIGGLSGGAQSLFQSFFG